MFTRSHKTYNFIRPLGTLVIGGLMFYCLCFSFDCFGKFAALYCNDTQKRLCRDLSMITIIFAIIITITITTTT